MLGKLWKIILNTKKVWGVDFFLSIKLGIVCLTSESLSVYFRKVIKTLDNKSASLDFSQKENVYWLELKRLWNSYPLEIKNSTVQNCNKNDILKFSM